MIIKGHLAIFMNSQILNLFICYCSLICLISCEVKEASVERLDGNTILVTEIDSALISLIDKANVHGLGIAIFNDNHPVYQKTFGYANYSARSPLTDSTNMYGASLSKAVFGVLVMKLVEEKVIDLDVPLESYLPKKMYEYEPKTRWHDDYNDLKNDTLYHKITARMCLNHTTGFPNWRWFEEDQKLRVNFEPGSRYSYSGEGLVYLQVVIERMLNASLEKLAIEKIFTPADMKRSSYQWKSEFESDFAYGHQSDGQVYKKDKDNEPRSASTLETTLSDFTSFTEALLNDQLITGETMDTLFSNQIKIRSLRQFGPQSHLDSTLNDQINLGYGMGWGVLSSPYGVGAFKEGHGDGFQHYSILFPDRGTGIIIMTNSDNGESIFKELLEVAIGDIYTPWIWQNYIPYKLKRD